MSVRCVLLSLSLLSSLVLLSNCLPTKVDSSAEVKDELIRLLRRMEEKINNDDQHIDEHGKRIAAGRFVAADKEPTGLRSLGARVTACESGPDTLTASSGTIQSPGYQSELYENNAYCQWLIQAPEGKLVSVTVDEMDIEWSRGCNYDSVILYDGTSSYSTVLETYCGATTSSVMSTGQSVLVAFETDRSVRDGRFALSWTFVDQGGSGDGTCGTPAIQPSVSLTRIVGGSEATPNSWPWQCYLRVGNYECGGSVIGSRYILTAAHCLFDGDNQRIPDDEITVGCGLHRKKAMNSDPNGQKITGVTTIMHENYRQRGYDYDIAVIQLPSPLTYNTYVQPVCLPSTAVADGTDCVVTGWGDTQNTGSEYVLRQVVVPTINWNTCKNLNRHFRNALTQNMMCAGHLEGGKDSCFGDSGGPLVSKRGNQWFQYGIVSFGLTKLCAETDNPGIYADVVQFLPWIQQHTGIGPSARMNGKDIVPETTTPPIIPVQTNELNAAEKELLDLLRLKFFEKDKKPGALDNGVPEATTPPIMPIQTNELNAAEKELLDLLRLKFFDNDKDIVKPTTAEPPIIPIQSNELNGAEKELLDLLRRKFFDKDKKSGARKA